MPGTPKPAPATPSTRSTLDAAYQRDWPAYFDAVAGQPARDTLLRALARFSVEWAQSPPPPAPVAIDMACGEGRDTRAILEHSPLWRVVAIDASAQGLERLRAGITRPGDSSRLRVFNVRMEEVPMWRPGGGEASILSRPAHLINASFALPFCAPDAFPRLWEWILASLAPGGRFAGQIFGDRDSWAPFRPRSHLQRDAAMGLFRGTALEHFEEVEKNGSDAMGSEKHHHLFHIVARKA